MNTENRNDLGLKDTGAGCACHDFCQMPGGVDRARQNNRSGNPPGLPVFPITENQVTGAHHPQHPFAELCQHFVAAQMPKSIVDAFEMIEVCK